MAIFSLLFSHPELPKEKPPSPPVATPDLSPLEREEQRLTVPGGTRRVDAWAELESSLYHRSFLVSR